MKLKSALLPIEAADRYSMIRAETRVRQADGIIWPPLLLLELISLSPTTTSCRSLLFQGSDSLQTWTER